MVVGVLERGGTVRTTVVESRKKHTLQAHVKTNVELGAELFTDALKSYEGLDAEYLHQIVDHAVEYVKGNIHTNGMENFWSHLKRHLRHLHLRDAVPFVPVFDRDMTDALRFRLSLRTVTGRRLTYKEVTGKTAHTCR